MMNDDKRNLIALFRYGVIAELITMADPTPEKKAEFFKTAASKTYTYIDGTQKTLSIDTIRRYYRNYINSNSTDVTAKLGPKTRSDKGRFRALEDDLKEQIKYYAIEYPRMPATQIYKELIESATINTEDVSLSTVNTYVKLVRSTNGMEKKNDEYRRYELEHINEVWCGDSTVLSKVIINGKKYKLYVIALIDDASRYITGADVFYNDNTVNLAKVMKKAVKNCGKPMKFNFDNGANYKSTQIQTIIANMGSSVHYNRPYTPTGKAKIERFFRTLKDHWYSTITHTSFTCIEEVKDDLQKYIQTYNKTQHSSLKGQNKTTPLDRFFEESKLIIKPEEDRIDDIFLIEMTRKATRDGVIEVNNVQYEVDQKFNGKVVSLKFSPDYDKVYSVDSRNVEEELKVLDKTANARRKRKKYKITEDGKDDE